MQKGRVGKDGGGGSGDQHQPVKTDSKGVALRAMQIFVQPMMSESVLIDVMQDDTLYEAKEKIQVAPGFNIDFDVPAALQRIYYEFVAGSYPRAADIPEAYQLENHVTLRKLEIHHGDTVALRW